MEDPNRQLIDAAVAQGILSPEQHRRMTALAEGKPLATPDERFRIMHGFSEVFISIGLIMLLGAWAGLLKVALGNPAVAMIAGGGTAWFLAHYFTFKRRTLLPAILCCLYASSYIGQALIYIWTNHADISLWNLKTQGLSLVQFEVPFIGSFLVLAAAALRFRIPFLMLPLGILFTLIVTLGVKFGDNTISYRIVLGLCGLSLLGVALSLDLKDPERLKRTSDFAFWAYVVGSPLTVHPLFLTLFFQTIERHQQPFMIVVIMILISGIISVGALLINRRALILSTLIYVTSSLGYLFHKLLLVNTATAILFTTFVVGLYVVGLGTCWMKARRLLMTNLTQRSWFSKLPPY